MSGSRRRGVSASGVLMALLGLFLLYLTVPNLALVIRAAIPGSGVPGTFVAQRLVCIQHPGHRFCEWRGEFRADDGARRLPGVYLYGGSGDLTAGARMRARDIGRVGRVYRPSGTHEWVMVALLLGAGTALLFAAGPYRAVRTVVAGAAGPPESGARRCPP